MTNAGSGIGGGAVLGDSLRAIRFIPALASSLLVVQGAAIARELGGKRYAMFLTAIAIAAPFSDAVIAVGRLAFLAGQGPIRNGTPVGGSIAEQTRATLQNIAAILERLGTDASAVVSCTCFLADLAGLGAFNAAYLEFFGKHRPARTTVQAALIGGVGVEITAVVALPPREGG